MFSENSAVQLSLFDFVETSQDAFAIFDNEDVLQYCNNAFADIFFANRDDIVGDSYVQLVTASYEQEQGLQIESGDLSGWLEHMSSVRRKETFRVFEANLTDGRWFLFSEQLNNMGELFVHAKSISEQKQFTNRVQVTNEKFRHLSLTDQITGIPNRKQFVSASKAELSRCWRSGKQAALMLVECDCIKKLSDCFEHAAADKALRHMAELIRETLREYDIFGRTDQQQFAVFLGESDAEPAPHIAERVRHLVETHPLTHNNNQLTMTVSIGLSLQPFDTPFEQLFDQAGKALYAAVAKGRNRVEIYTRA